MLILVAGLGAVLFVGVYWLFVIRKSQSMSSAEVATQESTLDASIEWGPLTYDDNHNKFLNIVIKNNSRDPIPPFLLLMTDLRRRSDVSGQFVVVPKVVVSQPCEIYRHLEAVFPEWAETVTIEVQKLGSCGADYTSIRAGTWQVTFECMSDRLYGRQVLYFVVEEIQIDGVTETKFNLGIKP